jgi:hypothetical protein
MFRLRAIFSVVAACVPLHAQTGIWTLELPPPGDGGYAALQTGGTITSGVASAWYNPALLPGLSRATGSNVHFAHSREDWFFGGISRSYTGAAATFPVWEGWDFGAAIHRGHTDYGQNLVTSDDSGTAFDAYENEYGLAAGLKLGGPVAVGVAAKFYDSRPSADARANGWAFDLGILANHRFLPFTSRGVRSLEVAPSLGSSLRNLGPDAWYVEPETSDPLPTAWRNALGLEVNFADVLAVVAGYDWSKDVHRNAEWGDPWQKSYGFHASLLGFGYGSGWLEDPGVWGDERHQVLEYELNLKRLCRVVHRIRARDFTSSGEALNVGSMLGASRGFLRDINPRFVIGRREVVSGTREGQDAWYFSVSL